MSSQGHATIGGAGTPGDAVRAALARADRLRRASESGRRLWTAAPWAAAACAAVAALTRLAGWSARLPLSLLAIALAALGVYMLLARRARAVTDTAAADLDQRASLRGELRSAFWFCEQDTRDPWVDFHLSRAAERVGGVDWPAIFPAPQAGRAKLATALLVVLVGTVALPPSRSVSADGASPATREAQTRARGIELPLLPAELLDKIQAMLAAAEASGGSSLTAAEVRDLLQKLDDLRAGKMDGPRDSDAAQKAKNENTPDLKALSERAKRDAENLTLEPQARDALSDLADKLNENDAKNASSKDVHEAASAGETEPGDTTPASASGDKGDKQDGKVQAVREAAAAGAVGMVMMNAGDGAQSKEAGLGLGGGAGNDNRGGRMPDLGAALRRETVEAQKDSAGENVQTDIRRKTEHGDAALAYTNAQPGAAERGRSAAPPAVPENRRAAVRSYFTRKQ